MRDYALEASCSEISLKTRESDAFEKSVGRVEICFFSLTTRRMRVALFDCASVEYLLFSSGS